MRASPQLLSATQFVQEWSRQFEGVVRQAAGRDGRLSRREARRAATGIDVAALFADSAVKYLDKNGQDSVSVTKLIAEQARYVASSAQQAANRHGFIGPAEQARLPYDLVADVRWLAAREAAAPGDVDGRIQTLARGVMNFSESDSPVIALGSDVFGDGALDALSIARAVQPQFELHGAAMAGGERVVDMQPLSLQPVSQPNATDFLFRRGEVPQLDDPQFAANTTRWRALAAELSQLTERRLFRFGTVEPTYVLVGRTDSGKVAGIMTGAVET